MKRDEEEEDTGMKVDKEFCFDLSAQRQRYLHIACLILYNQFGSSNSQMGFSPIKDARGQKHVRPAGVNVEKIPEDGTRPLAKKCLAI